MDDKNEKLPGTDEQSGSVETSEAAETSENPENADTPASDAGGESAAQAEPENPFKLASEVYDWIEVFTATLTVILVIFTFLARIAYVDGDSMRETLHDKDTLVVSRLFYTPKRNDIVVFQAPDSNIYGGIVKRVIATEGQTVDIDFENWKVTVDGVELDEPYVNFEDYVPMRSYDIEFPLTVPEGKVFVMGDNRNHSNDSRGSAIGCVDTRFIFGHVLVRLTPLEKFGTID